MRNTTKIAYEVGHMAGLEHPDTIHAHELAERIVNAYEELTVLYLKWCAETQNDEMTDENDDPTYENDDWDDFEAVDDEVGFDPYLGEYTYDV